jgi:hypothetical protein
MWEEPKIRTSELMFKKPDKFFPPILSIGIKDIFSSSGEWTEQILLRILVPSASGRKSSSILDFNLLLENPDRN